MQGLRVLHTFGFSSEREFWPLTVSSVTLTLCVSQASLWRLSFRALPAETPTLRPPVPRLLPPLGDAQPAPRTRRPATASPRRPAVTSSARPPRVRAGSAGGSPPLRGHGALRLRVAEKGPCRGPCPSGGLSPLCRVVVPQVPHVPLDVARPVWVRLWGIARKFRKARGREIGVPGCSLDTVLRCTWCTATFAVFVCSYSCLM